MKNMLHTMTMLAAVGLLVLALPAAATTREEVAKARAECATHKQKVKDMEARVAKGDSLAKAKADWEAACQHAEVLINDLNGTRPPVVVPPSNS